MQTRALHSTVTADGTLRLSIDAAELEPGPEDVIVRVDAAPINPTDIFLMLSMADVAQATHRDGVLEIPLAPGLVQAFAARVDKPLVIGTEGAGTVVAAGASPAAQALVGKVVAAHGRMHEESPPLSRSQRSRSTR